MSVAHDRIRAFALTRLDDGFTTMEVVRATRHRPNAVAEHLAAMTDMYIDRWDRGVPVWCMVVAPEDCPPPVVSENHYDYPHSVVLGARNVAGGSPWRTLRPMCRMRQKTLAAKLDKMREYPGAILSTVEDGVDAGYNRLLKSYDIKGNLIKIEALSPAAFTYLHRAIRAVRVVAVK